MVYKKRLVLCILVVIITSSILMNYEFGKGINNSEIEEPKLRNPIPIFLPTFFYIWEDRLYFQIEDDFYQYDISDKSNITYLSEIKIESYMSRIKYYENKMFSFTNIHNEIDDNYVFKIDIYELNENNIEKTRSINYQRDSYAHVLYVSQEYIVIRDYDSPISPVFIIDIGQPNPVEYPIEFSGDTSSPIDDVILDNDLLYILSVNVNWNQTSLLIFDVENLANPILIGSWSTYSFSNIFPNLLKKEDNKLYI
ncbi:MAG: hypothetical protein FK731_13670, partial [Asgard group archaeon]|nr:hypothetical protein [Asgard group archaeon]